MKTNRVGMLLSLLCAASSVAAEACVVPAKGAALIELYTSEGCSSCPPAEAWLNRLAANDQQVPIAFHVDYWAYLGWPDRFTLRGNEARHAAVARAAGTGVYTPGIYVNGEPARLGSEPRPRSGAAWWLRVEADVFQHRVKAQAFARAKDCQTSSCERPLQAFFAITEDQLSSQVQAGENAGRTLEHNHVARHVWQSNSVQILPPELDWQHARVLAWLEQGGQAREAIAVGLGECVANTAH